MHSVKSWQWLHEPVFNIFSFVVCRNAEKQFVAESDEIEPGTEWERIAKLCDFNPKSSKTSKDVSRMRSIILQLKQTPPAAKRA
jgi:hypothetical protein